jgi:hypothetical protein
MIKNIIHYQIVLPGGKEKEVPRAVGFIHGWDEENTHHLTCHFHEQGYPIPENSLDDSKLQLHYPMRYFSLLLDVFRNETPLLVTYDAITNEGQIMTQHELVGKGDIDDDVLESSALV